MHTMTKRQGKSGTIDVKALLREDEEFLRALVRTALQEVLEAEMTEALGAEKGERAAGRQGYRSGYYGRTLIARVGKLELRVPQDRTGRFSTELFERYQRSERALVAALAEMYVQGISTRKSLPFAKASREAGFGQAGISNGKLVFQEHDDHREEALISSSVAGGLRSLTVLIFRHAIIIASSPPKDIRQQPADRRLRCAAQ
jgi:transposase-like protein